MTTPDAPEKDKGKFGCPMCDFASNDHEEVTNHIREVDHLPSEESTTETPAEDAPRGIANRLRTEAATIAECFADHVKVCAALGVTFKPRVEGRKEEAQCGILDAIP